MWENLCEIHRQCLSDSERFLCCVAERGESETGNYNTNKEFFHRNSIPWNTKAQNICLIQGKIRYYIAMILLFLFFVGGYGIGWVIRQILSRVRPVSGACNISKRGVSWRSVLAIILVIVGFYFEIPLVVFFAGFTWYESRSKWCIAQSIIQ